MNFFAWAFPVRRQHWPLSFAFRLDLLVLLVFVGCCMATPAPQSHDFKPVRELPSNIPTCRQLDSQLNACIRAAFEEMIPRLRNGIPELNIPPSDPYTIEEAVYDYNTRLLEGQIIMRNVLVHGMSEAHVRNVDIQLLPAPSFIEAEVLSTNTSTEDTKMRMLIQMELPKIFIEGSYKANMKFNDVPMTPKGHFNLSMTDITITSQPEGELYRRGTDGHTYLRLTRFPTSPEVGSMRIYASGLVPDPALNAILLDLINQYWRPLYRAMLPQSRAVWEPLMISTANEFFAALPFDFLLTKD